MITRTYKVCAVQLGAGPATRRTNNNNNSSKRKKKEEGE